MKVGADTGGTFTDVVTADGRSTKVLSRRDDPSSAVAEGVALLLGDRDDRGGRPELLAHGMTVATNALLERRGAAVALVTTRGLGDVIEIARQDRPSLYDQLADRPEPLVRRSWRHEVPGRLAADGTEVEPLDEGQLVALAGSLDPGVEAVAVCLLHADLDPGHERAVAEALRRRGIDVTCSHEVSPEMREYERTVTTVINASLRPRARHYLRRLAEVADEVLVMTSAGGLLPALEAAELPAALLLSGPAGGVRAGAAAAVANGFPDAVTFDMGGTSTDVCLILDGAPAPAAQREVGGFTVRFPALDVHTIGAGGGSIARLDPGGALVVGPSSAGADPGPACYGRGGAEPTVTDANLVAGRIPADAAFGGLRLDRSAAEVALEQASVTADGVLAVVNANMERALRAVSVERGVDPRGLALVAFGGAGPLHAAELAEALDMAAVVIPDRAGVLSAVGLLTAPRRRDLVRSWPTPGDPTGLDAALTELATEAARLLLGGGASDGADAGADASRASASDPPAGVGTSDVAGSPGRRAPSRGGADTAGGGASGTGSDRSRHDLGGMTAEDSVTVELALDCRYRGQSHELTVPVDLGTDSADASAGGTAACAAQPSGERHAPDGAAALGAEADERSRDRHVPADAAAGHSAEPGGDRQVPDGEAALGAEPGEPGGERHAPDGGAALGAEHGDYAGTPEWVEAFHAEHERRNGYARRGEAVEVVALRATAGRPPAVRFDDLPPTERRVAGAVRGPHVLSEPDCTVWIPSGWEATAGAAGALVLRRVR